MKEKERYTSIKFQNPTKEDRNHLLRKLGLHPECEEYYQIIYRPKEGIKKSASHIPIPLGEFLKMRINDKRIEFVRVVKPRHYTREYAQLARKFGFETVTFVGGHYPDQVLVVSNPEYANEHKEKVLGFMETLRLHKFKLNEGECLQIDVCKTWKETSK